MKLRYMICSCFHLLWLFYLIQFDIKLYTKRKDYELYTNDLFDGNGKITVIRQNGKWDFRKAEQTSPSWRLNPDVYLYFDETENVMGNSNSNGQDGGGVTSITMGNDNSGDYNINSWFQQNRDGNIIPSCSVPNSDPPAVENPISSACVRNFLNLISNIDREDNINLAEKLLGEKDVGKLLADIQGGGG